MAAKATWAQAVQAVGGDEGRLQQYFGGDTAGLHPNFDAALSAADGVMRSKITIRYPAERYDAWTSETIPDYVRFHLLSLALGMATARDDARPTSISNYAGIAAGWLDQVAAAQARIIELDVDSEPAPLNYRGFYGNAEPRIFDRAAPDQKFNRRDPEL